MSQNLRSEKRRHLYIYLKVVETESGKEVGRVANLTSNGVLIVGRDHYEPGVALDVSIDLKELELDIAEERIDFHIVSRWSRKDINPDYYVSGFHVEHPDHETREVLEYLIDTIGFRE